jgi:CRP-like cAMP-binding protein
VITTEALSQIDLFSGLSDEQLATIARSCEEITCPKGKMLFREGQEAKRLFILLGGEVALQIRLTSRPENITVGVINQPHQVFGSSGIISPHNYAASALCQADSHVLTLDGQELIYVLAQNPAASFAFTRRIAEVISGRLRDSRVALLKPL